MTNFHSTSWYTTFHISKVASRQTLAFGKYFLSYWHLYAAINRVNFHKQVPILPNLCTLRKSFQFYICVELPIRMREHCHAGKVSGVCRLCLVHTRDANFPEIFQKSRKNDERSEMFPGKFRNISKIALWYIIEAQLAIASWSSTTSAPYRQSFLCSTICHSKGDSTRAWRQSRHDRASKHVS